MNIKGFTLLELLFVLCLCSVLVLLGISSTAYFVNKNEEQIIVDELRQAVHYARLKAIQFGVPLVLSSLDAGQNWAQGARLSSQNKTTGLLYQWNWHHPQWTIVWKGVIAGPNIVFSNNPIQAISNGSFVIKSQHTQKERTIILNRMGRIGDVRD